MNVQEAAKQLEINTRTVYHLCAAGMLGHMRIGVGRGAIRIDQADIDTFRRQARAKAAKPVMAEPDPVLRHIKLPPA
jgi:excisionase family DNA binding protein